MTKIDDLRRRWRKDADYTGAYDALGEQFDLAGSPIEAKTMVRLSPPQHARKLKVRGGRPLKRVGLCLRDSRKRRANSALTRPRDGARPRRIGMSQALRARTAGRSAGVGSRRALAGSVATVTVFPVMSKNSTE